MASANLSEQWSAFRGPLYTPSHHGKLFKRIWRIKRILRLTLALPPPPQAVMPVDLRRHEEPCWRLRLANTSCLSRLRLPCGTEGAVPRLWAARRLLDELKTSADTAVSRLLGRAVYTLLPARWARTVTQRCLLLPDTLLLANLAGPEDAIQVLCDLT